MLSSVEILSSPTADTGASLLLHCENRRYIFGHVSEGTQRMLSQRKISAKHIEDIFVSGPINWRSTGGLLGLVLTIGDAAAGARAAFEEEKKKREGTGKKDKQSQSFASLNIHGTKNLTHMLASSRGFILRSGFPLRPHEIREDPRAGDTPKWEPDWQDGNIKVWNVPVKYTRPWSKKRSYEDAMADDETDGESSKWRPEHGWTVHSGEKGAPMQHLDEESAQQIRAQAVRDMFDSNWRLDTLHEVSLRNVQLPAAVFTRDAEGRIQKYEGPLPGGEERVPDIKVLVRDPWPAAKLAFLPRSYHSLDSMCYIVKHQPRRGKFRVEVAKSFGVDNRDFKRLTAGECVPGKGGVIVTPEMVLEPSTEGHGFVIADLPNDNYIERFLTRPEWASKDIMSGIEAIYWIVQTDEVMNDPAIQSFMRQRPGMRHIVLSHGACANNLALSATATEAIKLNKVDPDRFPLPVYSNEPKPLEGLEAAEPLFQGGKTGAALQLAPHLVFQDEKAVPDLNTVATVKEIEANTGVLELAEAARTKISDPAFLKDLEETNKDLPNPNTEIITLGTGSALPSRSRNVSATLIRVPGHGNYLLDCGENTLGQLRRTYGFDGADNILKDLRAIYISHLHADHHLGTVSIIRRCREIHMALCNYDPSKLKARLSIIASERFRGFLAEYSDVELFTSYFVEYISHNKFQLFGSAKGTRHADPEAARRAGLADIETCAVDHCQDAMAVVLTLPSGLRIAYSGDCMPSDDFASMARGAHLLIHECTFDDELAGDAAAKKHSTMSQALSVARKMKAQRVIMTHFSQRYPKIPVIPSSKAITSGNDNDGRPAGSKVPVLFAFDYMRVKLRDFAKAEAFLPALQKLYNE